MGVLSEVFAAIDPELIGVPIRNAGIHYSTVSRNDKKTIRIAVENLYIILSLKTYFE